MSFCSMIMSEYAISGTRRLYALVRLLHACAIICILHFYYAVSTVPVPGLRKMALAVPEPA